jgi:hypothetical protein
VLTESTLRLPLEGADGVPVADLLMNAGGYGALVTVPPGLPIADIDGDSVTKIGPVEAVELLRRVNLYRLGSGRPELRIPPALVKRAKAETMPGIEALVPFPGQVKKYFAGRGAWHGTGLWVSWRAEFALEMLGASGYIRKTLTLTAAEKWLEANGHAVPWFEPHGPGPPDERVIPDTWEIVTRGDKRAGREAPVPELLARGVAVDRHNAAEQAKAVRARTQQERELREAVARAPTISPPPISAPVKSRAPTRKRRRR